MNSREKIKLTQSQMLYHDLDYIEDCKNKYDILDRKILVINNEAKFSFIDYTEKYSTSEVYQLFFVNSKDLNMKNIFMIEKDNNKFTNFEKIVIDNTTNEIVDVKGYGTELDDEYTGKTIIIHKTSNEYELFDETWIDQSYKILPLIQNIREQ